MKGIVNRAGWQDIFRHERMIRNGIPRISTMHWQESDPLRRRWDDRGGFGLGSVWAGAHRAKCAVRHGEVDDSRVILLACAASLG